MKVFNEKKNRYFPIARQILNKSIDKNVMISELKQTLFDQGFSEYNFDFYNAILGKPATSFDSMKLFDLENDLLIPVLKTKVPVLLTKIEKNWMRQILCDKRISCFVNSNTLKKLCNKFDINAPIEYTQNKTLYSLLLAIQKEQWVICNNTSPNGTKYKNSVVVPYKIEYSLYQDDFWLIGYLPNENKLVKMLIGRMEIVDVCPAKCKFNFNEIISKCISKKPITLELTEERGTLERALHMFSSYKKDGYYDNITNVHHLKIQYYTFDESEIINNIISLGPYVKVVEPISIINRIKDTLNLQKSILI